MMTVILTMIQEKVMSLAKEKIEAEQQAASLKKEVENVKVLILILMKYVVYSIFKFVFNFKNDLQSKCRAS